MALEIPALVDCEDIFERAYVGCVHGGACEKRFGVVVAMFLYTR